MSKFNQEEDGIGVGEIVCSVLGIAAASAGAWLIGKHKDKIREKISPIKERLVKEVSSLKEGLKMGTEAYKASRNPSDPQPVKEEVVQTSPEVGAETPKIEDKAEELVPQPVSDVDSKSLQCEEVVAVLKEVQTPKVGFYSTKCVCGQELRGREILAGSCKKCTPNQEPTFSFVINNSQQEIADILDQLEQEVELA